MAEQRTARRPPKALVSLWLSADDRDLITPCRRGSRQDPFRVMLDAARQAAQDALLNRTLFRLDSDRYDPFPALL